MRDFSCNKTHQAEVFFWSKISLHTFIWKYKVWTLFQEKSQVKYCLLLLGYLPMRSFTCVVIFLWGHLPVRASSCEVVFLCVWLPVRLSSVSNLPYKGLLHIFSLDFKCCHFPGWGGRLTSKLRLNLSQQSRSWDWFWQFYQTYCDK